MDARTINMFPIREYLDHIGITPAKDRGYYGIFYSPFRDERTPSMKVDYVKNLWIDYGAGDGGTLIDLVMRMDRCDPRQAMRSLERFISGSPSFSFHGNIVNTPARTPAMTVDQVGPIQNPALINYLKGRGIEIGIAEKYCHEVHYSVSGKRYFAVGFRNDDRGYELRNKYFKGCTSKAPTTVSRDSRDCVVFEGFIDYLSYLTLTGNPCLEADAVILNSVTNLPRAKGFIALHENVRAYLDNDESGRKATAELTVVCKNLSDQSARYSGYKDLNEYLTNTRNGLSVNRTSEVNGEKTQLAMPNHEEARPAVPQRRRGRGF